MKINHNISALNTSRQLVVNNNSLSETLEKLSSGLRINQAADDAAGLAISEKMRGQIRSLEQASRNIQDAVSLVQTAEGGLNEVHSLLQRGRELAVQAANGTLTDDDRQAIQAETDQILEEIDNIAGNTTFNGKHLLGIGRPSSIPIPGGGGGGSVGGVIPDSDPDTITSPEDEAVIEALKSYMLNESENLVRDYFGITADNADLTIYVDESMSGSTLAFVSYYVGADGKGVSVELHMNKQAFFDESTFIENDRIVAHEMTHAIMARSMNYGSLPKWFKEGAAEFIHGGDERVNADIYWNSINSVVNRIGDGTDTYWGQGSIDYSSGYVAVRYLHDEIKEAEGAGIKDVMQYLTNNQDATLDDALKNISKGSYAGGMSEFISDFKANGVNFINTKMNLKNDDTGAIGGFDVDGGSVRTNETIIPDNNNSTDDPLTYFNEVWPLTAEEVAASVGANTSDFVQIIERKVYSLNAATSNVDPLIMQIGANTNQTLEIKRSNVHTNNLGIHTIDMVNDAENSIGKMDRAIQMVSQERGRYGAIQNRLEHTLSVTQLSAENLSAAESRIRNTDMAKEMMDFTKTNILTQAAQAMLAQSNQLPQGVIQLLN